MKNSATMVKAGIFLVGRLGPAAAVGTVWWTDAVIAIGFTTMVLGGWRALRQHDLKLMLAFGTVSQLGLLFLLIGAGYDKMLFGGMALLAAHALFKATLFMVVGSIDHETGTRDLRRLHNLRARMPAVFWIGLAASASMAAVPLTFGFAAKEAAFDGLLAKGLPYLALASAASVLTVVYTGRFIVGAFGPAGPDHEPVGEDAHTPNNALTWAPAVLAAAGILFGIAPGLVKPIIDGATTSVFPATTAGKLVAWPGLVPALGWSLASLAVGSLLLWKRGRLDRAVTAVNRIARSFPTTEGGFRRGVAGVLTIADRSSTLIQNGSLPTYLGIIALVAVVVPSTAMTGGIDVDLPNSGGVLELLLAAVVMASAFSLPFIDRRMGAVILMGGVGYGVAGFYAVMGGPDLALTQLLVETLAVALFALVLRHLPAAFSVARTAQIPRVAVAVAVAVFVFIGGLVSTSARAVDPVSDVYLEQAVSEAGGANVVNVILVDFRGFDTLGEITVLAAATLGAAGLVVPLVRRRKDKA